MSDNVDKTNTDNVDESNVDSTLSLDTLKTINKYLLAELKTIAQSLNISLKHDIGGKIKQKKSYMILLRNN